MPPPIRILFPSESPPSPKPLNPPFPLRLTERCRSSRADGRGVEAPVRPREAREIVPAAAAMGERRRRRRGSAGRRGGGLLRRGRAPGGPRGRGQDRSPGRHSNFDSSTKRKEKEARKRSFFYLCFFSIFFAISSRSSFLPLLLLHPLNPFEIASTACFAPSPASAAAALALKKYRAASPALPSLRASTALATHPRKSSGLESVSSR